MVQKIQRNDPCPCGSGKKYKKCCGKISSTDMVREIHHVVFSEYFSMIKNNAEEIRGKITDDIINQWLYDYKAPTSLFDDDAVNAVLDLQNRIEKKMAEVIGNHPVYYWVHLYRRLLPFDTFNDKNWVTVALYRDYMEAAFQKYGKLDIGNDLMITDKDNINDIMSGELVRILQKHNIKLTADNLRRQITIKEFSFDNFIELLSLERLAREYWKCGADLRCIAKGASLILMNDKYGVRYNGEIAKLIQSIDDRNKSKGIFSTLDGISLSHKEIETSKMPLLIPLYNVQNKTLKEYPVHKIFGQYSPENDDFIPNFIWYPLAVDILAKRLEFMEDEYKKLHGVRLKAAFGFLYALSLYYLPSIKNPQEGPIVKNQLLKRAYIHLSSIDKFINNLIEIFNNYNKMELAEFKPSHEELMTLIKIYTLNNYSKQNIHMSIRGPRSIFVPTWHNMYLLDYNAIVSIIAETFYSKGDIEQEKGPIFEDFIKSEIERQGFQTWVNSTELVAMDDTKKEIDNSFLLSDFLVIIEAKCMKWSISLEQGRKDVLDRRIEKLNKALNEVDDKAKWLATHPVGRNYKIPENIIGIIPIVVTPFNEYIWSLSDTLWLSSEVPRICTVDDLISFKSNDFIGGVLKRAFTVLIKKHINLSNDNKS